jgi:hypothetical protein
MSEFAILRHTSMTFPLCVLLEVAIQCLLLRVDVCVPDNLGFHDRSGIPLLSTGIPVRESCDDHGHQENYRVIHVIRGNGAYGGEQELLVVSRPTLDQGNQCGLYYDHGDE